MTGSIWLEKFVAAGLASLLVSGLEMRTFNLVMIVMGQAHFAIAYWQQARAGKITGPRLLAFAVAGGLLVGLYRTFPNFSILLAVTTTYFAIHMAVDELYLSRLPLRLSESPVHLGRTLELAPFILMFSAAVCDSVLGGGAMPGVPLLLPWALRGAEIVAGCFLLLLARGYRPDLRSLYLLAPALLLYWGASQGWLQRLPAARLSSWIIFYHYFTWYIHYFLALAPERRRRYLGRVTVVQSTLLLLFLVCGQDGPGAILFQEENFYLWTLLHLITSTRAGDWQSLGKFPPSG